MGIRTPKSVNTLALRRLLEALFSRPLMRREVDEITGNVNGPDVIYILRKREWELPCVRIPTVDRDGFPVQAGQYRMSSADRRRWMEALAAASAA